MESLGPNFVQLSVLGNLTDDRCTELGKLGRKLGEK